MLSAVVNVFKIRELRNKILFTVALLIIYRIGYHIPNPCFDQERFAKVTGAGKDTESPLGRALGYMEIFTGGRFDKSSLFGLGIMPYITASIILMLLGEVLPSLKKLRQEGQVGHRKIQEYNRYLTVLICVMQGMLYMSGKYMMGQFLYPAMEIEGRILGVIGMTAGTVFLMWLGEQIDEYGLGNGISLIIMAGIVSRMPFSVMKLINGLKLSESGQPGSVGLGTLAFLAAAFVFVVAGTILITQGQRRIPIQQAKMMRGRRMYGGQRHYIPLRVNQGGVMPIIFASSFMMFPPILMQQLFNLMPSSGVMFSIYQAMQYQSFTYNVLEMVLIFLFAYFWVTVQFQPREWAKNLRDSGSFIPGLRPGKRTADYLESVMIRITYFGAAFLAIIAVVPAIMAIWMGIDWQVATMLGGTGLLIVVSVSLDLVQRIEAGLLMRSYDGFSESGRIKGAYS